MCGAGQPSQYNTKSNFTLHPHWGESIYFCCTWCVYACVRVRSRACARIIFVRYYYCDCDSFLLFFLACYNLLSGRAQFLWSHSIARACVCVFAVVDVLYFCCECMIVCVRSRGCLWVCVRAIVWAPELCSFCLLAAVVDVLYIYCPRTCEIACLYVRYYFCKRLQSSFSFF